MLGDLLPGDSTQADSLHQRPGQVEQHIPKTIHCLPQDASLGENSYIWLNLKWKKIWTGAHESHTSTPVVPSLRVTLVRDIACNIHCIDSGTYKKWFFLRILHGTALADHKLGVSHQNRKFCQQPEKVENLIPAISFSIIVPIACFLLKVDRSSLTVWKPPSSSLSGVTNRVNKSPSLIESCP